MSIAIARAHAADAPLVAALRRQLWSDAAEEAAAERDDAATFLARHPDGAAVGFAAASTRVDYVNGCDTSPVGFLEGVFVLPAWRRQGIGRGLIAAVAAWARARGLAELAGDAPLDNLASHRLHHACGFAETERVVFFRRAV